MGQIPGLFWYNKFYKCEVCLLVLVYQINLILTHRVLTVSGTAGHPGFIVGIFKCSRLSFMDLVNEQLRTRESFRELDVSIS